jgi:hypothetical protein
MHSCITSRQVLVWGLHAFDGSTYYAACSYSDGERRYLDHVVLATGLLSAA